LIFLTKFSLKLKNGPSAIEKLRLDATCILTIPFSAAVVKHFMNIFLKIFVLKTFNYVLLNIF